MDELIEQTKLPNNLILPDPTSPPKHVYPFLTHRINEGETCPVGLGRGNMLCGGWLAHGRLG